MAQIKINKGELPVNYHKEDHVFMFDNDIKEMSFYCGDDTCFVATFVSNDGQRFEFKMSRAKVMEHVERTSAHPEKYITNKGLVVAHFHRMAKYWYAMTRKPIDV